MYTINERVRIVKDHYFKPQHGSRKKFAEILGEVANKVGNWMVPGYPVGVDVINKIISVLPDVRYEWLAMGEEPMLKSEVEQFERYGGAFMTLKINNELIPVPEENYMMVEFKDLETAAGRLWTNDGDVYLLPESKRRLAPREYEKGNYLVVRVHGHSMDDGTKRSICEDDEILIKQCFDNYINLPIRNKLFVLNTNEGSVVKQILKVDSDKEEIICHSFNPNYSDYEIKMEELFQVFTVEKKVKSKIMF